MSLTHTPLAHLLYRLTRVHDLDRGPTTDHGPTLSAPQEGFLAENVDARSYDDRQIDARLVSWLCCRRTVYAVNPNTTTDCWCGKS
jgi:hypothetical protein